MHITLENATIYIAIIMFVVGIVRCVIITPLKDSITALQNAIEKLEKSISILDSKIDQHDTRLVRVEELARNAHKRIDRLDHIFDKDKQSYD